jgi:hypothetical protein
MYGIMTINNVSLSSMPRFSMGICFTTHASVATVRQISEFFITDLMDTRRKYLTLYTNRVYLEPLLNHSVLRSLKLRLNLQPICNRQEWFLL